MRTHSTSYSTFGIKIERVNRVEERLTMLEKMIVPFLTKLHSTGDKEYIYWPNRKPTIEKQIEKILKLTRD